MSDYKQLVERARSMVEVVLSFTSGAPVEQESLAEEAWAVEETLDMLHARGIYPLSVGNAETLRVFIQCARHPRTAPSVPGSVWTDIDSLDEALAAFIGASGEAPWVSGLRERAEAILRREGLPQERIDALLDRLVETCREAVVKIDRANRGGAS